MIQQIAPIPTSPLLRAAAFVERNRMDSSEFVAMLDHFTLIRRAVPAEVLDAADDIRRSRCPLDAGELATFLRMRA